MSSETIRVEFLKRAYSKPVDEDGLAWGIYICTVNGSTVKCLGKLEPSICQPGIKFEITGRWVDDKKYGRQFQFTTYSQVQPNGMWGTIAFLKQADGVGEQTALKIWAKYGPDSIHWIVENPGAVVKEIGLPDHVGKKILAASEKLKLIMHDMKARMPLIDLFKGTKLTSRVIDKIIKNKVPDPVARLKKDPFTIIQYRGVGFKQCDSLRKKLKLPVTMPERALAACYEVFTLENDQTWLRKSDIKSGMKSLLGVSNADLEASIKYLIADGYIVKNSVTDDDWYATRAEAENERIVAEQLFARLNMPGDWPIESILNDPDLTQHQKEVVSYNMAHGGRLITITGSPGSGKSFVLAKILQHMREKHSVAACAPTGKAAQRLTSLLKTMKAVTVHSLMEPVPTFGTDGSSVGWVFQRNKGNKIPENLIAVDECSMMNNWLASQMFKAIPDDAHIILVGDKNQLPPVGPGTMLRDLEKLSNLKELIEIQRNEGAIVSTCVSIRDEQKFCIMSTRSPGKNLEGDNNLQLVLASKDPQKRKAVEKVADSILNGDIDGVDNPIGDVQFLTATHNNSHIGRIELNKFLQGKFNPDGKGEHAHYKIGDKIICTKNNLIKDPSGGAIDFIANGELGYVVESHEKWIAARMESSNRIYNIHCGKDLGNGWDLAHCITVHKGQGSQWPVVVVVMGSDYGSNLVMSREWFYTAISRAKLGTIVISTMPEINSVIKKKRSWDRRSLIPNIMEALDNA